jgi:transposase
MWTALNPKRGRPRQVGAGYRRRWLVERCFGWMDNCRRLVVRYDRHVHICQVKPWPGKAFSLVAIILWCTNRILK